MIRARRVVRRPLAGRRPYLLLAERVEPAIRELRDRRQQDPRQRPRRSQRLHRQRQAECEHEVAEDDVATGVGQCLCQEIAGHGSGLEHGHVAQSVALFTKVALERGDGPPRQNRTDAITIADLAAPDRRPDPLRVAPVVAPIRDRQIELDAADPERVDGAIQFAVERDGARQVAIGAAPLDAELFAEQPDLDCVVPGRRAQADRDHVLHTSSGGGIVRQYACRAIASNSRSPLESPVRVDIRIARSERGPQPQHLLGPITRRTICRPVKRDSPSTSSRLPTTSTPSGAAQAPTSAPAKRSPRRQSGPGRGATSSARALRDAPARVSPSGQTAPRRRGHRRAAGREGRCQQSLLGRRRIGEPELPCGNRRRCGGQPRRIAAPPATARRNGQIVWRPVIVPSKSNAATPLTSVHSWRLRQRPTARPATTTGPAAPSVFQSGAGLRSRRKPPVGLAEIVVRQPGT